MTESLESQLKHFLGHNYSRPLPESLMSMTLSSITKMPENDFKRLQPVACCEDDYTEQTSDLEDPIWPEYSDEENIIKPHYCTNCGRNKGNRDCNCGCMNFCWTCKRWHISYYGGCDTKPFCEICTTHHSNGDDRMCRRNVYVREIEEIYAKLKL